MKSDQEFLAGVYAKARRIAAEEKAAVIWTSRTGPDSQANSRRLSARDAASPAGAGPAGTRSARSRHAIRPAPWRRALVAAIALLIPATILFTLYLYSDLGYRKIENIHIASFFEFQSLLEQSDLVVIGQFDSFASGVYLEEEHALYTDAVFKIGETIKGSAPGTITIRLQGGRDPFRRVYADLETDRSEDTVRLLFLIQDETGLYRLSQSSSGSFTAQADRPGAFMNRDRVEITLDQIIKNMQGEK